MVDAGQAFLGGLALKQQRRLDAFNQEQILVQQNQGIADALIKSAAEIQSNAAAVGKNVDLSAFRERLEGLLLSATALRARQFGGDPDVNLQFVDTNMAKFEAAIAAAASAPSASDVAKSESEAAVAGASAGAGALTKAGVPTTLDQTARAAGILPEDDLQLRNITDEEGKTDIIAVDREGNVVNRIEGGLETSVVLEGVFSPGTKKDAEGRVLATTQLLRNTAKLTSLLSDETVGLIPAFRGFLNTTLAQATPGAFDKDRAAFERFTKLTRQSALRVVSDESRFSEADREFIFDLFPETGVFESEQNAAIKLLAMQAFFLDRLGPDLTAAGLEATDFDTGLKPETVKEATANGFLNEDQAVRMLEMIWPGRFGG